MNGSTSTDIIMNYMPEKIRELFKAVTKDKLNDVMEIRLRAGGAVYLVYPDRICYLSKSGELMDIFMKKCFYKILKKP